MVNKKLTSGFAVQPPHTYAIKMVENEEKELWTDLSKKRTFEEIRGNIKSPINWKDLEDEDGGFICTTPDCPHCAIDESLKIIHLREIEYRRTNKLYTQEEVDNIRIESYGKGYHEGVYDGDFR